VNAKRIERIVVAQSRIGRGEEQHAFGQVLRNEVVSCRNDCVQ
jgi:hypothetical protein